MNGNVRISRPVFTLVDYNMKYGTSEKKRTFADYIKQKCTFKRAIKLICSFVPVVKVIRKYKLKEYLIRDILAGLTVCFIHLPQGLAYSLIASLQPIHGIYTTFFPVLFYTIFGTSPYISIGPNANMAVLTRTVVEREASTFIAHFNYSGNSSFNVTQNGPNDEEVLQVKVSTAAACSVLSGFLLGALGFFQLGFLTSYLSKSFTGGFSTASAILVASSQVPKLFGITTESYSGAGGLVRTYIDLFRKLGEIKIPELVISMISIAILLIVKVGLNEKLKDKMKIPIPIELILAVAATLASALANFEEKYEVVTVGPIPSGFIAPTLPKLANAANLISDAVVITLVAIATNITMAKLTAKKHGIKMEESQELFAYGASNILSGLFGCIPSANSLSRTSVLSSLGAKTTLNGFTTVTVFLLLVLVVGKFFFYLPVSVLASMIVISTKDLILQYRDLPKLWKINKYDFTIWIVTNISSTMLGLYYGLIIGLLCSFLLVIVQNQMESGHLINVASPEDIIYRLDDHNVGDTNGQIKIFRFPTNIYFATAERFKKQMYTTVFNPEIYAKKKNPHKVQNVSINHVLEIDEEKEQEINTNTGKIETRVMYKPNYVIIDCSMISYIDLTGANIFQEIMQQYTKFDITVYLTGIQEFSFHVLTSAGFFKTFPESNVFFDVFDAITVTKNRLASV